MSLQDELLKAGLISADNAKKHKADQRKRGHERKKNKMLAADDAEQQAEARRKIEAEVARKREQDRQLNQARNKQKRLQEQMARARQLIQEKRLNDADAEIKYNFLDSDGRWIRALQVLPPQQKGLAAGRLAIVRGDRDQFDFALVHREIAVKLGAFAPERIVVLHPESDGYDELSAGVDNTFVKQEE
ncbi:MAG: hypothetical protein CSA09_04575 [Candidatus Contendobacter odensis]|uniref:Nucleoprotein/polynucleotide-associated enzyme n=1 Tax=Candidatus Contendibacter odensensis TaxID=1400860 RepID=A0A2G6PE60_9GAMM|nr:MAG: hypothetical protein CSA09_04575 [Candidatus Contendobacter odensis]